MFAFAWRSAFAGRSQSRQLFPDSCFAAFLNVHFGQCALPKCLQFHHSLIGFNLCHDITHFDRVADSLAPFHERALGHRIAQFGHFDKGRHNKTGLHDRENLRDYALRSGQLHLFERGTVNGRGVQRGNPEDRSIQFIENLLLDG